jgi:arsenate reductase
MLHVIEYLQTGWTKEQLLGLFAAADLTPREALRVSKSPAEELGLTQDHVSNDELLEAMVAHPILVNRPIVCTSKGVRLCRPSERVFDILPNPDIGPVAKEDGTIVIDAAGQRIG